MCSFEYRELIGHRISEATEYSGNNPRFIDYEKADTGQGNSHHVPFILQLHPLVFSSRSLSLPGFHTGLHKEFL